MKAVHITRYGGRLLYSELPIPTLQSNQVLLKMKHAPINPSDVIYSRGAYGIKKELPAILGFEGVGQIVEINSQKVDKNALLNKYAGCWVSEAINSGTWADYLVTDIDNIIKLNDKDDVKEFHSPMINPGTVMGFLTRLQELNATSVVINAAYSQLGQMCVRTFAKNGIQPICIIRKQSQVSDLLEMGAKIVLVQEEYPSDQKNHANQFLSDKFLQETQQIVEEFNTTVFLDSVGGPPAAEILKVMPKTSKLISYGAFQLKKFEFDPQLFVFQQKSIEGFWLSRFYENLSEQKRQDIYQEIHDNIANHGDLSTHIFKEFDIQDVQKAIFEYRANSSLGKCVLNI